MTDKAPLLTDKEIDQIHLEEWSDGGEYRIVLRVARKVQALVADLRAAGCKVTLTDAMVEAAGRALSDRHANGCGCGMDKDIMWGSYSDEFKEQARAALGAAHGIKESDND